MTHTYKNHFFHIVWSTKHREPVITTDIKESLHAYMGGIVRDYEGSLLKINGMPDHVHLLLSLENLSVYNDLIRDIKSSSTKWAKKNYPSLKNFGWQEGYGSFSVSGSIINNVIKYIENQETHHQKRSFEEEYLDFLNKHGISYDPRFVFD